jgi:carboxylesterase
MTATAAVPFRQGHGFKMGGGATAIVLIHGLTGTPAELRTMAKGFVRAGYSVYAVQLAGHCGSERDLVETGWQDWLDGALASFDEARAKHETVFVGGLSMGALLSLLIAALRPGQVSGCLLYSPTMFYDGWSIPRATFLMHAALLLGLGRFLRFREKFPYGIKDARLRARILMQMETGRSADAGLLYMPGRSLRELLKLISHLKRALPTIRTPSLILHARDDDITSPRNAAYIAAHIGGRVEKILLDDSYHMITIDHERDLVLEHSVDFIRRFDVAARRSRSGQAAAGAGR